MIKQGGKLENMPQGDFFFPFLLVHCGVGIFANTFSGNEQGNSDEYTIGYCCRDT